ncbi:hypothetical protein GV792_12020 [Nocardia cyriacigeorgica]|uniref:Uncharacterized protein n=1 Tax=Nocardia cyriacigeorgica TaxID=135487 RepID=A0A6P1CZF8_9NOCA|nr:hypothetical protein [Nocardia cyriacigeorgica]NEW40266.1 hypothetical protein [Nocardia cyriacigeorgica]NEW43535.1 hypothetical protein [Nocardia cyriacigeorgica]NEW50786.1 hypothetical protein [Nocardia cyriacigeorgica]
MTILAAALIAIGLLVTVAVFIRKPADHRRAHVTVAELQARLADETEPDGEDAANEAELATDEAGRPGDEAQPTAGETDPATDEAEPLVADSKPTAELTPESSAEPHSPTTTDAREGNPEAS